jgi:hypothetical protein
MGIGYIYNTLNINQIKVKGVEVMHVYHVYYLVPSCGHVNSFMGHLGGQLGVEERVKC